MATTSSEFYSELDNFTLDMPGGQKVCFKDNQTLLRIFRNQYPKWEHMGNVSSVPMARVPRLFLNNEQMSEQLRKEFNSLQKGETSEKKVYQLLMNSSDKNQRGFLVFPNLNGREIFKTPTARVEIDTIIVHPEKGIFICNVKSQGGKGLTPQKIQKEFGLHCNFLRNLLLYGHKSTASIPPIHFAYFHLHDDKKNKFEHHLTSDQEGGKVLVLSKKDLAPETFNATWAKSLIKIPNFSGSLAEIFEVFAARLVVLSSLENSVALIHDQMSSNYVLGCKENKKQFDSFSCSHDTKTLLEESSQTKIKSKTKRRFIIWTTEQLKIISTVTEHLQDPSRCGLRLIVSGCKGSGKTTLLVFIATIADILLQNPHADRYQDGRVVVYNGNWVNSPLLTAHLQRLLLHSGVAVTNLGK